MPSRRRPRSRPSGSGSRPAGPEGGHPQGRHVLVELRKRPQLESTALAAAAGQPVDFSALASATGAVAGLSLDSSFPPISMSISARTELATTTSEAGLALPELESESVLVRGTMAEDQIRPDMFSAGPVGDVTAIFADPVIEPTLTCGDSPPLGTARDVARLLDVPRLARAGMDGNGVLLAIVDNGINLAHLRSHGLNPNFSAERSWVPTRPEGQPKVIPGQLPVGHGTMCAFDALIAAPRATLLDIAVLRSQRTGASAMDGLLSDAVLAFSFLLRLLRETRRPGDFRSLVVSNSWGMFQSAWDLPPGHPGNYSDNPAHPFNRLVATLERAGADILFAAGNCGRECKDHRCGIEVDAGIYGANSHPAVLTVAGVDTSKLRVGYSTRGPGHLEQRKPDICGFTHFAGSGVYPADGGTSAATPVVAGLVAAFRSRFPAGPDRTPAALRELVRRTAEKSGPNGFDNEYGFGIVSGRKLAKSTLPPAAKEAQEDIEDLTDEWEIAMNGSDQEFIQALNAFGGVEAGGAQSWGASFEAGSQGGSGDQEFMQALAAFGGAGVEAGPSQGAFGGEDQEFMQALSAYGGPAAGSAAVGVADVTAAPTASQICSVWNKVRPIVNRILPFLGALPGIGTAVAAAFRALGTLLDGVCRGQATAAQVCQKWRGGLRAIVVRVASAVGHIPFIGKAAAKALRTLVGAVDAVCKAA